MIHQCYFEESQRPRLFTSPLYRGFGLYTSVNADISRNCPELAIASHQPLLSEYGAMLHLWRNPELDPDPWIGFTSYRQLDKFQTIFTDRQALEASLDQHDVVGWGGYQFIDSQSKRSVSMGEQTERVHPGLNGCMWKLLLMRNEAMPQPYLIANDGLYCNFWAMSKSNFDDYMRWSFPLVQWCLRNTRDLFVQSHPRSLSFLVERLFICWYLLRHKRVTHVGPLTTAAINNPYAMPGILEEHPGGETFVTLDNWNASLSELCRRHGPNPRGIIHIGAHYAEERESYRRLGVSDVLWIEADPAHLPQLQANLEDYPAQRALQACLSNIDSQLTPFFRTNNRGESSSILPMGTHREEFREIHVVGETTLETTTFARLAEKEELAEDRYDFLVLDVQGAELLVLQGMGDWLKHINGVWIEVNIAHLYQGCALLPEIDEYLRRHGLLRRETLITRRHYGDAFYLREGLGTSPSADLGQRVRQTHLNLVTQRSFTYHLAGHSRRAMELFEGGRIGAGRSSLESSWLMRAAGNDVVFEITGDQGRICCLHRDIDGVWRGELLLPPHAVIELTARGRTSPAVKPTPQGFPYGTNAPLPLIDRLRVELQIKHFVETGTYLGSTAKVMAERFDRVSTVELEPTIHARAAAQLAAHTNVRCYQGDTMKQLPEMLREIDEPALLWLDAHWSGGETAKGGIECPVLGELQAVYAHRPDHIIMIDDARLFLAPPPPPHQSGDWPTFQAIREFLHRQQPSPHVRVVGDVIVAVPAAAAAALDAYCAAQADS